MNFRHDTVVKTLRRAIDSHPDAELRIKRVWDACSGPKSELITETDQVATVLIMLHQTGNPTPGLDINKLFSSSTAA